MLKNVKLKGPKLEADTFSIWFPRSLTLQLQLEPLQVPWSFSSCLRHRIHQRLSNIGMTRWSTFWVIFLLLSDQEKIWWVNGSIPPSRNTLCCVGQWIDTRMHHWTLITDHLMPCGVVLKLHFWKLNMMQMHNPSKMIWKRAPLFPRRPWLPQPRNRPKERAERIPNLREVRVPLMFTVKAIRLSPRKTTNPSTTHPPRIRAVVPKVPVIRLNPWHLRRRRLPHAFTTSGADVCEETNVHTPMLLIPKLRQIRRGLPLMLLQVLRSQQLWQLWRLCRRLQRLCLHPHRFASTS